MGVGEGYGREEMGEQAPPSETETSGEAKGSCQTLTVRDRSVLEKQQQKKQTRKLRSIYQNEI